MCNRGYGVIYRAQYCEIRSSTKGNIFTRGIRTENNVYVLKEDNEECYLGKQDECWLWHRRLGKLNFNHIIRLSKMRVVRYCPKIMKPQILFASHAK